MLVKLRKLSLVFSAFICIALINPARASASQTTVRLGGTDRYETSIKISQDGWSQSSYVILASGEDFPDALCAAPLAKKYNAPILLVTKDSISYDTTQELARLGVRNAFIIGGTGVISTNVESQLSNMGISFTRIGGVDRFDTSVQVANYIGTSNGVVVSSGQNFPDALSIAPIAAAKQMPILLTNSNALPSAVQGYLSTNYSGKAYVVGGTGVISDNVLNSLNNPQRLSGSDRFQTNLAVINQFTSDLNLSNIYVATGNDFADALGGAASAAENVSPIILTDNVTCAAKDVVKNNIASINTFKVLGGTGVISDTFIQKLISGTLGNNRMVLGYTTYYYSGDTSSYYSMLNNKPLINEIATDTYTSDSSGNITGDLPTNQLSYANSNNIKAMAMVTNAFNPSIGKVVLESSANRQNLINNILNALVANNYKGVNIDFEGLYASDRSYYTTFIQELYNTLHPRGYLVTAAVPAKTYDSLTDGWSGAFDYVQLGKYLDQVVIMTYDEHYLGGSPGPIASIGWVQNVVNYAVTALPREKILLGIAAYGYDWASSGNKAYGINQVTSIISQNNVQAQWDSVSQSPYFNYSLNGVSHTVWYENAQSISYKLDLVNNNNLLGVAIWRLGLEDSNYWNMINSKIKN